MTAGSEVQDGDRKLLRRVTARPGTDKADAIRTTRSGDATKFSLYDDLIRDNARLQGVRTDLVRAVVQVESGFNAWAKSPEFDGSKARVRWASISTARARAFSS